MGCVSSYYCYRTVIEYKEMLDEYKAKMWKNYQDMDLRNASIQADIEEVVGEMMAYCDSLKSAISGYYFE